MVEHLTRHPRWPLYRKLRRAVAREIQAERARRGLEQAVTPDDVDTHIENHFPDIVRDLQELFAMDLEATTRWYQPGVSEGRGLH